MKKINVYDEIREAAAKRTQELDQLNENLRKAQDDKSKAEQDAADAITSDRLDLYKKAKNDEREAADQIEFSNIQLERLNKAPLFNDDKAKCTELKNHVLETQADQCKSIAKLLKQINAYLDTVEKEYKAAEDAGKMLDPKFSMLNEKMAFNGLRGCFTTATEHTLIKTVSKDKDPGNLTTE